MLDEIDKAHPDILVALMNTLDVGRLTPASGDTALDVRHCVFIATSNLATDEMAFLAIDNPDIDPAARLRELLVSAGMRSELINRFDEVIPFRQISQSAQAALIIHSIRRAAGEFGIEKICRLELQPIELADIGFGDRLYVASTGIPVKTRHQQKDDNDEFFHDDCLPGLKVNMQNSLRNCCRFTPTRSWRAAFR